MGQTLPNGIYLPAEGERNCYDGLEGNWRSLDSLISTVSGKASASHTHGNITNDGKVGTTANKPLITGTGGAVQAGAFGNQANTFCEGNDSRLSDARTPVAHTHTKSDVTDLFNSANTWGATNTYTITGDVPIKITNNKDATNPSATEMKDIRFSDVNGKIIGGLRHSLESDSTSKMHLYSRSFSSDGSSNFNQGLLIVNNKQTDVHEVQSESNLIPSANNTYDLGTPTNKWKTLNGTNPGALSLPDNSGYTNISGNITDLTGSVNSYTPPFDGYVMVNVNPNSNNYAYVSLERVTVRSSSETTSGKNAMATIPVIGGKSIDISVIGASIAQARFTPCLGNV